MCPNFQVLKIWKDRLLPLVVASQGDCYTLWISMAITWQKKHVSCPVPLNVKICNFQVWLLKTMYMFFFQEIGPTCSCSPFLPLEQLQQQVVDNPKSTLGVHTFFEGWRLTTTIILTRVSLLGWKPENGPLEKDSSAIHHFFWLNSFAMFCL